MTDNWRELLFYKIILAEETMSRSTCPDCGFWMLERTTQHGHPFMGCSGFPECEYSGEIDDIYDDEN